MTVGRCQTIALEYRTASSVRGEFGSRHNDDYQLPDPLKPPLGGMPDLDEAAESLAATIEGQARQLLKRDGAVIWMKLICYKCVCKKGRLFSLAMASALERDDSCVVLVFGGRR